MNLKEEAFALQEQIVAWRREFHQCPELKMDTPITSGKIVRILKEIGIEEICSGVGGNGVTAVIHGTLPGKCLGIRADCDGLPIREETGLPFASTNGNMHACGHDAHTAMALGAAKILWNHRDELQGSVKFVFQPYEEGIGGAKAMIADGVMENPHIDAMIALHTGVVGHPDSVSGDLSYQPTASTFACTSYSIEVEGKSSHVATPQLGVDPLLTSCYIVTQLQAVLSRETEPGMPVVLSINVIKGGTRNNIIPDKIYMEGTLRTMDGKSTEKYYKRLCEISSHIATSMNCAAKVRVISHMDETKNDSKMTSLLLKEAQKIVGKEHIFKMDKASPAGEDFAMYAHMVPSVYFFLSAAYGDERDYPHHNSKFNIEESNFWKGSGVFSSFALNWQKEK